MSRIPECTRSSFRQSLLGLAIPLVLAACASQQAANSSTDSVDHSGRMRGYVESSRVTDFCPDQASRPADARCIVTRGWDYVQGRTIVRTFDPLGRLLDTQYPPGADLSLTQAERARAETLMRADWRTRDLINQPGVMLWHGGFAMREPGDKFCDKGTRCIRVIAAVNNGDDVILHSVVDLMSDRVVYPFYVPSGRETAKLSMEH